MVDINTMLREQARNGLQMQLDTAVTNGDTETARKITKDLEALAVTTAPKAPPYSDTDVRAELEKIPWFGTDPRKSAKAVEFGKTLDPKKFANAEAFAAALVKTVEEEFKTNTTTPPPKPKDGDDDEDGGDDDEDGDDEDGGDEPAPPPRRRRSDGPNEGDANARTATRRSSGPWTKLTDAPQDIQKEIRRQADKFVSSTQPKEVRETFIKKALDSHYTQHQRKGKK